MRVGPIRENTELEILKGQLLIIISLCLNQQDLLDESTENENSFFSLLEKIQRNHLKDFWMLVRWMSEKKPGQLEQKEAQWRNPEETPEQTADCGVMNGGMGFLFEGGTRGTCL